MENDNKNYNVVLENHMNNEHDICRYARISYVQKKESHTLEDDTKLVRYLVKNKHLAPFEHGKMTFTITAPISILRQFLRYRSACFSELSLRYRKGKCQYDIPPSLLTDEIKLMFKESMDSSFDMYDKLLAYGVPKEDARFILPMGTTSSLIMTIDLRNCMHLILERTGKDAQSGARIIACKILYIVESLYPNVVCAYMEFISSTYGESK